MTGIQSLSEIMSNVNGMRISAYLFIWEWYTIWARFKLYENYAWLKMLSHPNDDTKWCNKWCWLACEMRTNTRQLIIAAATIIYFQQVYIIINTNLRHEHIYFIRIDQPYRIILVSFLTWLIKNRSNSPNDIVWHNRQPTILHVRLLYFHHNEVMTRYNGKSITCNIHCELVTNDIAGI